MFFGGKIPYFKIILCVIFIVAFLFSNFKWFSLLSKITKQKEFIWSFYALVGILLIVILLLVVGISTQNLDIIKFATDLSSFIFIIFAGIFVWATLKFRKIEPIVKAKKIKEFDEVNETEKTE